MCVCDYREESEVGGAVEEKLRAVMDDMKVSGTVMSSQVTVKSGCST